MKQPPNILFIMTDQQRYDAMECHGGQAITPNLDKLAGQGTRFTSAYCGQPICSPSRAALLNQSGAIFVLVLSRLAGEAVPLRRWVGAGIAIAGVGVILAR